MQYDTCTKIYVNVKVLYGVMSVTVIIQNLFLPKNTEGKKLLVMTTRECQFEVLNFESISISGLG